MSEPTSARGGHGRRWYVWESPDEHVTERYWSVTTIIGGGVPKPALIGWAAKMTALAAIKHPDKVAALLAGEEITYDSKGVPNSPGANAAYKFLTGYRWTQSNKAADLGTRVHEAFEAYMLDKPMPSWPDDIAPYMESAVQFLKDFEVLVEMTEASVFNRTQRYAGTLDAIVTINGERWLIDGKTGGVWPEAALQMAAYAHAEFIGRPDKAEEPMPKIDRAAVLDLKPDGYRFVPVDIGEDVYYAFLYAREVFKFQEEISKRCIGDDVTPLQLANGEAVAS